MGHPKLKKKTYSKPTHPWQKARIEEEKILLEEFGLKNKKEVWRVSSLLRKYAKQAKNLIAMNTPQAEIEKMQLLNKLASIGLIEEGARLEDILTITIKDIMSRRLQSMVRKNGLAKSIRQARQFITHEHISVGDKKITSPSYIVSKKEENLINFAPNSPLFNQEHPERIIKQEPIGTPVKKEPLESKKVRREEERRSGRGRKRREGQGERNKNPEKKEKKETKQQK